MPDQIPAHGEGGEELIVQIIAIGDHDNGWIFELWAAHELTSIESHQQALAGALRMPDYADLAIALRRRGLDGFFNRMPDGMKLVIARDDLRKTRSGLPKNRKIMKQVKQPAPVENAFDQDI